MKTTRRRLIEFMRTKKAASAAELARVLHITAADARHHLTSLEDEGVVTVVDTFVHGRGRPTQLYGLSSEKNRHNMDALTNAVMSEWLEGLTVWERDAAMRQIANRISEGYLLAGDNLTQRISRAVRYLNEMNYVARWEAHIDAPRILISHCPYAPVVGKHPEICDVDGLLVEIFLSQHVTRLADQDIDSGGGVYCIFRVDNR